MRINWWYVCYALIVVSGFTLIGRAVTEGNLRHVSKKEVCKAEGMVLVRSRLSGEFCVKGFRL